MNFLDIPTEVIDGGLLPFLEWNDLLRLRRVCHATKDIVTGHLRVHPELAPELEINEEDKGLEAFMEMGIPTTKLFLNNSQTADEFYSKNKEVLSVFLEEYGPAIKFLRVHELSMLICGEEWDFLEGLKNLQTFEADRFGVGENSVSARGTDSRSERLVDRKQRRANSDPRRVLCAEQLVYPVPDVFKQFQVVKIGRLNDDNNCQVAIDVINHGLLSIGENWEYVALPFQERPVLPSIDRHFGVLPDPFPRNASPSLMWGFRSIRSCIEKIGLTSKSPENLGPRKYNLKVVDFANWTDTQSIFTVTVATQMFRELCLSCVKKNVKLENVHPYWFLGRLTPIPQQGIPILSLVGLQSCVFFVDMPNLEKIEIRSTYHSTVGNKWREERPDWPALKMLDITVDSRMGNSTPVCAPEDYNASTVWLDTKQIFHFFFQDVVRPNLIDLRLNFVKEAGGVAVPKAKEIVESCPNLKKLTIVNWPGKNKDLLELFGGLPGLEELSLDSCKNLGNVTFVGLDTRDPVFLKLKKLKKLSLKGLDQMPKITDLLFSMVLRHLNLTHFIVTSGSAVKSVTVAGIQALLEGSFAGSIEKFPFQDWSLEGVSVEEFKQLEKQFRSYDML